MKGAIEVILKSEEARIVRAVKAFLFSDLDSLTIARNTIANNYEGNVVHFAIDVAGTI